MNTLVVVVRRPDGRLYPAEPLTEAERDRIRGLEHALRHRGLSYQRVQRALFDQHGVRRSIGAVFKDLTAFECPRCADSPSRPRLRPGQCPRDSFGRWMVW